MLLNFIKTYSMTILQVAFLLLFNYRKMQLAGWLAYLRKNRVGWTR